jgi:hypothetical protein
MTEVTPGADGTIAPPPAAPSTPAEAATQLAQLKADPKWTEALMRGGPEQKRTFHDLHELIDRGDNYDLAIAGEYAPGEVQSSDHVQNIGVASMLREAGVPDGEIKEFMTGHTTTKGWFDATARLYADKMSDAAWVKRFNEGGREEKRLFHQIHIVLSGGIREQA